MCLWKGREEEGRTPGDRGFFKNIPRQRDFQWLPRHSDLTQRRHMAFLTFSKRISSFPPEALPMVPSLCLQGSPS